MIKKRKIDRGSLLIIFGAGWILAMILGMLPINYWQFLHFPIFIIAAYFIAFTDKVERFVLKEKEC